MSERTKENKKLELMMAPILVFVVAMLGIPFAISLFRDSSAVAFLIQAVPFVLIATAVGTIMWASKVDK